MKEVARVTGVSVMTVSLSLRGDPSIPAATRNRILAAAKKLNYRKNPMVSALMSGLRRTRGRASERAVITYIENQPRVGQHPSLALFRAGAAEGVGEISLGLVPLSPSLRLPGPLRAARKLGALFYDFDGLNNFKAKLAPQERRPIYYMHDTHVSPVVAVGDLLRAFAGGSLRRFAFRTAIHGVRRLESLRVPS